MNLIKQKPNCEGLEYAARSEDVIKLRACYCKVTVGLKVVA